jgi:opacity protein-like surface antigen
MGIKGKIAIAALLSATTFAAHADTAKAQKYIGGNANFLSYEETGAIDASLIAVSGRLGTFINENFSFEARVGLGLIGDDETISGTTVDIDLNHFFGVYARAGLPINEKLYPYALLGYTRGEVEASAGGFTVDEAESDTSFGFGVDFKVNDKLTLNAEYINLLDKDGAEVSGFNLGIVAPF